MGQLTQFFQPPLYWQQFEDLTQSVVELVYNVPRAEKIGRPGQAQDGVDVYAEHTKFGELAVQCKRLDDLDENNHPLPGGTISGNFLRTEAAKAQAFDPSLDIWILATTAKRDVKIQREARLLSQEYRRQGRFQILLWFWDDYISWLNAYPELQEWYYRDVIQIRGARDQDRLIIETIATAFHRPAFTDPLGNEHFDDFAQALKDTQTALRTGELVDRQSRHVIRKAIGGWRYLDEPEWKARLKELDQDLAELRNALAMGIKDGRLEQQRGYLEVRDPQLGQNLDARRRSCLKHLNDLLVLAALPPI
ncbi:hypothetical protein [Microvirga sp. 17 mud 1-3]|uniref:hypothetical protein n=1 Tax=Microvirga sp. 17 mud 1-3 TaxID=2082949 RepID=UPI000D6ACD8A|nr:hypothetical protein [Microvirga sp. 17 mud 1-3]AWM85542.1 hypothetical protein C4E04_01465 [Microvirga sp. 17 mud 1-3]